MMGQLHDARSLLFVPGHRPERYAKAGASGVDLVCIDLEDAVPSAQRAAARRAMLEFIAAQDAGHRYGVRVSRLPSADGLRDLLTLHDAAAQPAFVMLAKTEAAAELQAVAALLPGTPLIALVESARGLHAAAAIAGAHPQVQALMFGGADLAADLGCEFAWEPLLHARCALVAAAATSGLAAIDVPWLKLDDPEGARAEAARAAALGYSAKALIHPSQVTPVHAGLAPTAEALERAQRTVAAVAQGGGAQRAGGQMIDRPVQLSAERLLRRAGI
jgi:citrate lyase beta subunit